MYVFKSLPTLFYTYWHCLGQHQPLFTMPSPQPISKTYSQKSLSDLSNFKFHCFIYIIIFLYKSLGKISIWAQSLALSSQAYLKQGYINSGAAGGPGERQAGCNNLKAREDIWDISNKCSAHGARTKSSMTDMRFMSCSQKAVGTWGKQRKSQPCQIPFSLWRREGWMGKQTRWHMRISHSTTVKQWFLCQLHREAGNTTLSGKVKVETEAPLCVS